jgi:hypothetical protein
MDINIVKAILGIFLIFLGIPGILFALALFFLPETPDLTARIVVSTVAGFIPLLFLLLGLKLLLPVVFQKPEAVKEKITYTPEKSEKSEEAEQWGSFDEIDEQKNGETKGKKRKRGLLSPLSFGYG